MLNQIKVEKKFPKISCKHAFSEIEGEIVCINCGVVHGVTETFGVSDKESHNILGSKKQLNNVLYLITESLNLPQFVFQTALHTSIKLQRNQIPPREIMLFAIVHACRLHNIPRSLNSIFDNLDKITGRSIRRNENSTLRTMNRIVKKIKSLEIILESPDSHFYLKTYLAKIQSIIVENTDLQYFELISRRAHSNLINLHGDPCIDAKNAILKNTSKMMHSIIKQKLREF